MFGQTSDPPPCHKYRSDNPLRVQAGQGLQRRPPFFGLLFHNFRRTKDSGNLHYGCRVSKHKECNSQTRARRSLCNKNVAVIFLLAYVWLFNENLLHVVKCCKHNSRWTSSDGNSTLVSVRPRRHIVPSSGVSSLRHCNGRRPFDFPRVGGVNGIEPSSLAHSDM